jgi:outer membrane protein
MLVRVGCLLILGALGLSACQKNAVTAPAASTPQASATAPAPAGPLKILVIDQQTVLRDSLAGQDIGRQAAALRDQIQGEITAEQQAIINAQKDLTNNASIYSPAQREQKMRALDARQRASPMFEQRKSQILQVSVSQASDQVAAALRPILQSIIEENKATLLLDRGQVMFAAPSYDVTQEAIKRLNATLTKVKVVRANLDAAPNSQPPSGSAPAPQLAPSSAAPPPATKH